MAHVVARSAACAQTTDCPDWISAWHCAKDAGARFHKGPRDEFELGQDIEDCTLKGCRVIAGSASQGIPLVASFDTGELREGTIGENNLGVAVFGTKGYEDSLLAMVRTPPPTFGVEVVDVLIAIRALAARRLHDREMVVGVSVEGRVTSHDKTPFRRTCHEWGKAMG
jgi:hypothetical protein